MLKLYKYRSAWIELRSHWRESRDNIHLCTSSPYINNLCDVFYLNISDQQSFYILKSNLGTSVWMTTNHRVRYLAPWWTLILTQRMTARAAKEDILFDAQQQKVFETTGLYYDQHTWLARADRYFTGYILYSTTNLLTLLFFCDAPPSSTRDAWLILWNSWYIWALKNSNSQVKQHSNWMNGLLQQISKYIEFLMMQITTMPPVWDNRLQTFLKWEWELLWVFLKITRFLININQ